MKSKTFTGLVILGIVGVGTYLYLKDRGRGEHLYEESLDLDGVVNKAKPSLFATKLNSRQKKLVTVLKKRPGLATTDILKSISGVTDRTLRRDLNKLIELGVVKKIGSTKSSKYYIKK